VELWENPFRAQAGTDQYLLLRITDVADGSARLPKKGVSSCDKPR
jgi:hypothetical protein